MASARSHPLLLGCRRAHRTASMVEDDRYLQGGVATTGDDRLG